MRFVFTFFLVILSACQLAPQPVGDDIKFLNRYPIRASGDYKKIPICYGVGCKERSHVKLSSKEWQQVAGLFSKVDGPKTERAAIAKAISKLELFTGKQTPTHLDKGRNDQGSGPGQKDCVDETIDTTTYLLLLQERGLLKRHVVYDPAFRTAFLMVGAHYTAVIQHKKSGELFAVDSWFEDNGGKTHIVPLKEWEAGWRPASAY